ARQKRTIVGGLTFARRTSASTLASTAKSGSASITAATCCCPCDSASARSRIVSSTWPMGLWGLVRRVAAGLIGRRSEKSADRAGHAIIPVDREQGAPFVERRAWMRDAAAHEIAYSRRIVVGGEAQIGVVVVL